MRRATVAALVVPLIGCASGDKPTGPGPDTVAELQVSGFPLLAQREGSFELWVTFASTRAADAASLGRFHINDMAQIVTEDYQPVQFAVDAASVPKNQDGTIAWQLAVSAFITLESHQDDPQAGPTLPALIAGPFAQGQASLDIRGSEAIGRDFAGISGSFHLATPTTPTGDELEGIWFAAVGGQSASLVLPDLPAGWVYGAWHSLLSAEFRSLGTFTSAGGIDSNGPGPNAGVGAGYLFPGEDFPWGMGVDLLPGSVLLTIEPEDGRDGNGPFTTLELLGSTMPMSAATLQPMANVAAFPTASVTLPTP